MRVFLSAALALAALAAPAHAAVVGGYASEGEFEVYVRDTGGERNRLTVSSSPSFTRITVRDRGAPSALRAEGQCSLRAEGLVWCPIDFDAQSATVHVTAGAGDDLVLANARDMSVYVFGGPGDDRLRHLRPRSSDLRLDGGGGDDVLTGGRGGDDLYGGLGRDILRGLDGNDLLSGDGGGGGPSRVKRGGNDVLDGGPGRDLASWDERQTRVTIDLGRQIGRGRKRERDALRSVEGASGGSRNDTLLGDQRSNLLLGRGGSDLLVGRGGPDVLGAGFPGPRVTFPPRDRAVDDLRCGKGEDEVSDPGLDPLPGSCERISLSTFGVLDGEAIPAQPQRLGRRRLAFTVVCSLQVLHCRRRVILRHRGVELGRSPRRLVKTNLARVVVRLRRPLPRRGPVTVLTRGADGRRGGFPYKFAYRIKRG